MPEEIQTPIKTPMSSFSMGGGGGGEGSPPTGSVGQLEPNLEQRVADLEMRPKMPASGTGNDNDVLTLDGPSPRWEAGGAGSLPGGTNDDDMLVWNGTQQKWVAYTSSSQIMRWWDGSTSTWKEVEVPADDGKVLQTATPAGLVFDYMKWR